MRGILVVKGLSYSSIQNITRFLFFNPDNEPKIFGYCDAIMDDVVYVCPDIVRKVEDLSPDLKQIA